MAHVTFSPLSRQDLIEIADYIAKDNRANSLRFLAKLQDQCTRIGQAPLGYVPREDLAPGLRMAAVGRYVIFFRVVESSVRIQRILNGARNLPVVLKNDED
jgi:toxin ParE1/3/4